MIDWQGMESELQKTPSKYTAFNVILYIHQAPNIHHTQICWNLTTLLVGHFIFAAHGAD